MKTKIDLLKIKQIILTKKEHFKDLLHHLYYGEKEIENIIDAISAESELLKTSGNRNGGDRWVGEEDSGVKR